MNEPLALTCESARPLLATRPDSDADQAALAQHLDACPGCAEYQASQQALDGRLAPMLVMDPPEWLTAAILREIDPQPGLSWWARPNVNLALQWSFYVLLTGGLVFGLLLPFDSLATWTRVLLAVPEQIGVAFEVLMSVIGLIPVDPILGALEDASWLYESAALALVFWWLSQERSRRPSSQT
jgi:hypothetical protein